MEITNFKDLEYIFKKRKKVFFHKKEDKNLFCLYNIYEIDEHSQSLYCEVYHKLNKYYMFKYFTVEEDIISFIEGYNILESGTLKHKYNRKHEYIYELIHIPKNEKNV